MPFPTVTPLEALTRLNGDPAASFTQDGFTFSLDGPGPCCSDVSLMAPLAQREGDEYADLWFTEGDFGDPITASTGWVEG